MSFHIITWIDEPASKNKNKKKNIVIVIGWGKGSYFTVFLLFKLF